LHESHRPHVDGYEKSFRSVFQIEIFVKNVSFLASGSTESSLEVKCKSI